MKYFIFFSFLVFFNATAFCASMDINIVYEASKMKVKETVCDIQPDIEKGYIETEEGCFSTMYVLDVPMYGFIFEPKSVSDAALTKCAYYISFFDSAVPKADMVTTEVYKEGEPVRVVESLLHDRTFQGLVLLKKGENLRLSSKAEPSYLIIYIIAAVVIAVGAFLVLRRR